MRFRIRRASDFSAHTPPTPAAFEDDTQYESADTALDLEDGDDKRWSIEINTLEELVALTRTVGKIVVYPPNDWYRTGIMIYDGYLD